MQSGGQSETSGYRAHALLGWGRFCVRERLLRAFCAKHARQPGNALARVVQRSSLAAMASEVVPVAELVDAADRLRSERLAVQGHLVAGFAHEVRNPLNAALLQIEVCQRRLGRPRCRRAADREGARVALESARSELRRIERLVHDFLAFAQPQPLALEPIQIGDLLRGLSVSTDAPNIDVRITEPSRPHAPLLADPVRLREAIEHLVDNAVEAMPAGGSLTISAEVDDSWVLLAVSDTGQGIADTTRIFDAFYSTKPSGTGLGLSLVHRIVTDHGGRISVESRPGRTTFSIRLPLSAVR